ncbi:HEAT repeat domain-containing protein [Tolypothrix sp. FACHB-123]|uniref:HEAT repeat domain-containing protein n=1 Tax=Tolypothrix sp. FACHB-123 TaxID=2692868 RepID=UPI001689CBD4|nr:HEAT repeat domain-containing protein [Tolypothrix sp. FACHB-123]MBD2357322.1 HEAT repeat domain-containing protein [Tolypothrix sp. FACHB-123]
MNADFQHYLESVCHTYQHWWEKYTITDVEGRRQNSPFEGLMVATVSPKQDNRGDTQEKTERLPVQEGLRKYADNHVLLVGKPGSGKSTALARLLLEEAEKAKSLGDLGCIPVLVELRQYTTSVLDLIQNFLHRHGLYIDVEIKTLLRNRQFLLLVDGVNELPNEEARRELKTFRENHPKTPMIFTTRDLGVGGDLGIEQKLEMQPLTAEQMQQFIRAYLPETGEEMLQRLGERLRSFGETPLLLWMLCELFKLTNDIPPNLGLVFRQFTQFYGDKIKDDVPVDEELRGWWKQSLEALAFTMMQGESPTELRVIIDRLEAEEILTKFLEGKVNNPPTQAQKLLKDLLKHHLIQISSNEKIEFRHQLLQEYYAAECLLQKLPHISNEKLQRDYLNYLKWTEPLALMLALVEKEASAVGVVKLALEVDLELGARLAGEVKPEFQKKTVDLILELEVSESLKIEFLESTRSRHGIAFLTNRLQHKDSVVRSTATYALRKIKDSQAVAPLIHALNHQDSDVRRYAAYALGEIKDSQAVAALIHALHDPDSDVRSSAAYALGKIKDSQAVAALIHALHDPDSDVRRTAAQALGEIKDSQAVAALIHALNHLDDWVRITAEQALRKIKDSQAVAALIAALNHQDSDVRRTAAQALGEIKDSQALTALIHALNDQDDSVRRNAAYALGEIKDSQAVAALIHALNDQDDSVRRNAASALGKIKDSQAVAALIHALNDQDANVRSSAASALGKIKDSQAVAALIHVLNDQDDSVRRNAASALGEIKDSQALAALIHALNDQDDSVRRNAASALGEIKDSQALAALIHALNDQDDSVRRNAASALGEIKDSQALAALIHALNDQDANVRSSAARALGEIGSSEMLSEMWKLRLTGVDNAKNIISNIQERYKFYNHEIFHSASIENATQTESKTMQYQDFQILVDKNHQIRASSEQGDVSSELRLDMNEIELALELIELNKTNDKLLKRLGNQLYQALFPNQINARFHATIAGAEANKESVRLRLIFQSPQLAALPWEFLYDAESNTFLGNNIQTVLSRYIDVPLQKRDIKTAKLPLKVLLVISSPTDLATLDATGEATLINSALEKHIKAGQIELDIIKEATTRNINQKLREKPYNIFHFIGHSVFKDNKGYIALEDDNKQAKLMDEESFANFFLGYRSLGLAVLNCCQGAEVSEQQIFTGIAPNLVQRGIPAVVAMQYSIRDTTAKIFADEFYRTLALGYPVDTAIQTTRNAISQEVGLNQRDFATPVLYMRAKDGIILDVSA